MEKIDVLKLVRENQEKFKKHMEKMKELEEREKQLNYDHFYKNYDKSDKESNDKQCNKQQKLTTIPELETTSVKKTLNEDSVNEIKSKNQQNNKYINYYDSQEDNISDYRSEEEIENVKENQDIHNKSQKDDLKPDSEEFYDSDENNLQVREIHYDTNTDDSKHDNQMSNKRIIKEKLENTSGENSLNYFAQNEQDNQYDYQNEKKLISSSTSNRTNTNQSHPTPKFSNNYRNFQTYSKKLETSCNKSNLKFERPASAYTAFTYSTIKKIKLPEQEKSTLFFRQNQSLSYLINNIRGKSIELLYISKEKNIGIKNHICQNYLLIKISEF
jgi:hypothetical protein